MRLRAIVSLIASATVGGACGPYANVGQKLDAGFAVTNAQGWVSVAGTDVHILVLGQGLTGDPTFAFSSLSVPVASGLTAMSGAPPLAAHTFEGAWKESSGTLSLTEHIEFRLPNEGSKGLMSREGASRIDGLNAAVNLQITRGNGTLTVAGDQPFAGTYVPMAQALAHLGTATPDDARCAYYVANLAVMTTQARILYFGSANMLQYRSPETFQGTISGGVRVAMSGGLTAPDVDIQFQALTDFPGVTLDQGQRTHTDSGGNGTTTGTVTFAFAPQPPAAAITGSIVYDLQITNGYASAGQYTITLVGGATGTVDTAAPPSPSIASCLGLD